MNYRTLLFLAGAALITACGASGPVYQPATNAAPEMATIYVYRPKTLFQWGGSPEVYLDGVEKFSIRAGGYGVITVAPGTYELKVEGSTLFDDWYPGPVAINLTAQPGEAYYLRLKPVMESIIPVAPAGAITNSHAEFIELPPAQAKPEIATMKLSD